LLVISIDRKEYQDLMILRISFSSPSIASKILRCFVLNPCLEEFTVSSGAVTSSLV